MTDLQNERSVVLNENNLRRRIRVVNSSTANRLIVNGRSLINYASNDYLGLARDPRVIQASVDATQRYGSGSGSSPLLSGFSELHQQLSEFLCDWKSADPAMMESTSQLLPSDSRSKALLFPTGFAANLSVLGAVLKGDCHLFCDRKNHASIIDGIRLATSTNPNLKVRYYRHRDFAHLDSLLSQTVRSDCDWIVTDSVFSMDGTIACPKKLLPLVEKHKVGLIVDEAHATGVMGHRGAGLYANLCHLELPILTVGTMSKALGAMGGFVVGPEDKIEEILQQARSMIYSTSLPPGTIAAALTAAQITKSDETLRQRVVAHVNRIQVELNQKGWVTTNDPGAPLTSVIVGDANTAIKIAGLLEENGIFAPAIRPPTVRPLECRIRISPTATMLDSEIDALLSAFDKISAAQSRRLRTESEIT